MVRKTSEHDILIVMFGIHIKFYILFDFEGNNGKIIMVLVKKWVGHPYKSVFLDT